ncbi:urease accessory protein UreD [Methylobacterium thuringiense]|uniref:Urease accessory protein UreD n=1 Tax=Methylobacterium thuringiense TaxID=1003091 RepID=A0ABQ4TQX5_9HYPH|nr:urease accessory protein UreD [Methylobacterium thuringiense]GJE57033.1 Urease accessory protein UreD [Methylobacterium thuringiense]
MHEGPVPAPARQRSHGIVRLRHGPAGVADLFESGPSRLRFPRSHGATPEAILVNTAGGIACGDRFELSVALEAGARLVVSTTAAEKIYRSDGPVSCIDNRLDLAAGARLDWLPQETILYDGSRLRRRFEADLAADSALLVVEIVAFGRAARGERLAEGLFEDIWRIRRDGRLVYADALRLDGAIADRLSRPAIGGGAAACATLLDASPDAESRLDEARALLERAGANGASGVEAGASAWNRHLALRCLAPDVSTLRRVLVRFLTDYRAAPLPRVWQG